MKKILFIISLIMSGQMLRATSASDVAHSMEGIANFTISPIGKKLLDGISSKITNPQRKEVFTNLLDAIPKLAAAVRAIATFVDIELDKVKDSGNLLGDRFKCLKGGSDCETEQIGCSSKTECIYNILQNIQDLIKPVVETLVVKIETKTVNNKPVVEAVGGALYTLASLKLVPEPRRTQVLSAVGNFGNQVNNALDFLTTIGVIVSPGSIGKAPLKPEEKARLKEAQKVEPVALEAPTPADEATDF